MRERQTLDTSFGYGRAASHYLSPGALNLCMVPDVVALQISSIQTFPHVQKEEALMRKLALTLTAATLVLGMTALTASAQTQGAAGLNNATPIATKIACRGPGPFCPWGWVRRCGPWGCRCVRCW
jgi:hypothetical protein